MTLRHHFRPGLVIIFLVILFTGCSTPRPASTTAPSDEPHYSIVIDAGSSGSRLYVYKVNPTDNGILPEIRMMPEPEKVSPGISDYEKDPDAALTNINTLLEYAKSQVPVDERATTPVYVMATAGMRLLSEAKRDRIMNAVATAIENDGAFDFRQALTISGRYEGLYGWLALNYLDDGFDPGSEREGLLEMGGASTQIAFTPDDEFKEYKLRRELGGEKYEIFSRSFLYMGINETEKLAGTEACFPVGYDLGGGTTGTGECDKCAAYIRDRFIGLCEGLECDGPHCIMRQSTVPLDDDPFIAVSSFYYGFDALGLDQNFTLPELYQATDKFCSESFDVHYNQANKYEKPYVYQYCLAGAYYWNLLKYGYGFPDDATNITFANDIGGNDITWTLGAVIDLEHGFPPEKY